MKNLTEKVAILTGASGAIGSATARALVRRGVNVVLAAPESQRAALDALAAELSQGGVRALVVPADVTRRVDVDRLVATALTTFRHIDILANIAGIGSSPSLIDATDAEIERVIAVNLLGCARTMHAVIPIMQAQGGGSIVNIGSIAGSVGVMGIYSASKFGLRGLTDTVRREVRHMKIGVTLIEPGFVASPMNGSMEGLPSPDIVADAIVSAVERPRRHVVVPKRYQVPLFVARVLPSVIDLVFGDARIQERLNRDARAERAARNAQ